MELKLEVVLSSSIKRKKPWPRFCWLGQEKESVFLLDDKRISEINMVSGRTKKKTPKLHPLLASVVTMSSSHNGMWLCGLLVSGELFLWNRDKDLLKTAASVPEVVQIITSTQGNSKRLSLQVSCDGMRVLLVAITGQAFLWECMDVKDLTGLRDGPVKGQWAYIQPLEESILPSPQDKEASQHTIFVKTEVMGDTCLSAFVFTSEKHLIITVLKIQWNDIVRVGLLGYSIQWATRSYSMSQLTPPCQPVKSRGALVPGFSPDGRLLAIALNQRNPKATQVLFVSTQNFVSISSCLGGCGSKKMDIPSKYIRSYWVGSISWSPGSLFLACVLKRGSLLMLVRLGGLLTLTSSGCSVDFGPAHFLPLHPLVTYCPPVSAGKGEASVSSSSMSARDILRQRYSVTWHPRLLYLIVSDGYMATVMRVRDRPSPASLLKTLLKETSKDLEKTSCKVEKSQVHVKAWLDFVSCLNLDGSLEDVNLTVTCGPNITGSIISEASDGSRLPLFLQDQQRFGGTKGLLESMQVFLEDESDLDGIPAGSHVAEGGRLEFAPMFDTLHALETQNDTLFVAGLNYDEDFVENERKAPLLRELGKIQSGLLTAWAFCMSLGGAVEHRVRLLEHTLCCVVRLAAILHLMPSSMVHTGEQNTFVSARLLHLIKALLSFLPWDSNHSNGPHCLRMMVEFSKRIVHLLLTPLPDSYQSGHYQVSSQSLCRIIFILQLVSDSLDHNYSLNQKLVWSEGEECPSQQPNLWHSDVYHVPLLQDEKEEKHSYAHQARPVPQRPSSRLLGVWQLVYHTTQQYAEQVKKCKTCGWEEEEQQLSLIMSQIQAALQAAGQKLEEGPALLSYPGEHLFLCGSYTQSANALRLQICQESNNSSNRSAFQETRLCLALLYTLLSQYHLREAQELGDHMAQLILLRAGHHGNSLTSITDSLPCTWLPGDLHSEAACAVVQTLGRFMTSYFTNQPLYILPAHNVVVLPPLHLPHAPSVGRLVPLSQEKVARAVRQQHLSDVWTVDYAQDLLLLGGLLPEAAWMAYHLGDWKTAVSLSLAYTSYCTEHFDFTWLGRRELHLPKVLEPKSIFQAKLECLLGNKPDSQEYMDKDDMSITDPLEGEDWDLFQASIQEILKASIMAGVNVMSFPLSCLVDTAKDMCSSLPALVPTGLYLPSPPLYCPQPSPNTQDHRGTVGQFAEVVCRHKVSGVLQRLLILLRSGHCCHPAAQWYISHLRRARHILHKIKKKYSYTSAAQEEKAFPDGLLKLITHGGYFRRGQNKDDHLDHDTIHVIMCFRDLCALCWMLHARDQLSIHCRKYQAARQKGKVKQISCDPEVNSACVDALRWACRLLPFSRFLSAEEILQDIVLSLIAELPSVPMVADTLVRAFPEEEESVRVPLREKYKSLMQRLKRCKILEGEKDEVNETMMILIQDKFRQRRKHLVRLERHLAPPELHLWEKDEEEDDRGSKHGMAMLRQLSLGTSLSTSTLTDCGLQPVGSDVDTAENTSEATFSEQHCGVMASGKRAKKDKEHAKKSSVKIKNVIQEEGHRGEAKEKERPFLPVVGTWEFELEDEEYLNFLDLFLSYVLEKGSTDGADSGRELPLLKGFCSKMRERELHSLTFDVLTTIHRRQRDELHPESKHTGRIPPVFRAGCCYKPGKEVTTPELQVASVQRETPISRPNLSVSSHPGQRTVMQKGLFGLRQQSSVPSGSVKGGGLSSEASFSQNAFTVGWPPKSFLSDSVVSVEAVTELQQGLDPKLEAQFPKLGRLLEWMVRWADRRVLPAHHVKMKKDKEGATDEGVVIRVKASAPAILTSLSLLECRYAALMGTDHYSSHVQVPEMQLTVAPALQPDVERKLERESSVDTGYPGSTHTPITGLDHNLQQAELSISSCTDESEEQTFQRTPLPADQFQMTIDSQQRHSSSQPPCLDDLDVTPEKESRGCDTEGLDVSLSDSSKDISANIFTSETSLKLADLDNAERPEEVSSSSSLHNFPREHPECPALLTVQPKASVCAEPSDKSAVLLPNTGDDPPSLQPQSSTAGAPTGDSTILNQPFTTSPTRQRLGEDLFRLVQHINYMSLSEVLGASFSSVQLAQQSSSLAQPDMNSSHPNVPSSSSAKFVQESNALSIQTTIPAPPQTLTCVPNSRSSDRQFDQITACRFADQPATRSSDKISAAANQLFSNQRLPSKSSGAGVNEQEIQPLSIQAESPDIHQNETRGLIPSSRGLLTTTDSSHVIERAPVLLPFNGGEQSNPAPQVSGVKLLKLRHPLSSQDSTPHYPPAQQRLHTPNPESLGSYQHKLAHNYQATFKKKSEEKRNRFSVPTKPLSFNPPHDPTPRSSQPQVWASGQSIGQGFPLLPPAFPSQTPTPVQGLHLLQLQTVPHSTITFPRLPLPSWSRPSPVIAAPVIETPMIKLLHIESGPKMILPQAVPSAHMNHLISMEEPRSSGIEQREAEVAQMQLLKVDQPTERPTTASSCSPRKRQKRREEKATGRKKEITFRPNDSIIPTQEAEDVPVRKEPAIVEDVTPGQSIAGSSDSLLTGQRLLDKVFSTSAELHAFASTSKRPPECQDAFTNTDQPCLPILVDKAVSVQASVMTSSPKSQSSGHFQMCNDDAVRDTEGTPQEPEKILDLCGRQFISVLDLEDVIQHEDLPPCPNPEAQHVPSIHPSSAELHVLATSVIRSAAAEPQSSVTVPENFLKPITPPDILEECPSSSHCQPSRVSESVTLEDNVMVAPSVSEIFRAIKAPSDAPRRASSSPTVWFSSRLSELDAQLAALQNIADQLEMDFSNSRVLVNRLEKLSSDVVPNMKTSVATKKTVRLSVPLEAWTSRPEPALLAEMNSCAEDNKNQDEKDVLHQDYANPGTKTSLHYSTSPDSNRAGSSYLHSPPGMKDHFLETSGISHEWTDMNLGQTELSDTLEILDELVREGYLSPTDWDLSTSHTAHHNSAQDQQQSSRTSTKAVLPQDDRRELRIWMRKKQRERLAAYQKHRESLRERERKPFSASTKGRSANRNQTATWRNREEKQKFMLLERYKQRMREAYSLAVDFTTAPAGQRSSSQTECPPVTSTARSISAPPSGSAHRIHSESINNKRSVKSLSGQALPHLRPQSVAARASEDSRRKLGLDRPVTFLPGDRLSQVTRRGMLSNTKSHSKLNTASRSDRLHVGGQRRAGLNSTFSAGAAAERGIWKERTIVEGGRVVDHSESHRQQATEESNAVLAGLLGEEEGGARGGVSETDWLDDLSESAGSSLSKIDWAAIEKMVAGEEP